MRTPLLTISLALIGCYEGYDDDSDGGRALDPIIDVDGADIASNAQECDLVDGDIMVTTSAELDDAPEFSCWDLAGTLTLQGPGVTSLATLKHLRSVAGLLIKDTALTTLDPHRTIEVLGVLAVEGNSQLTSLQGLRIESASLEAPSDELRLMDNPVLTNLGEVAQVMTLAGALIVDEMPFTSLAFPQLDTASFITIKDNDELTSVDFPVLDTLTDLTVDTNRELTALKLPKVETIHEMRIVNADALTSVNDFEDLETITNLYLEKNDTLASLGDLMNLDSIVLLARVRDNPDLSQCLVDQLDDCAYPYGTIDSGGNLQPSGTCATWSCNN